MSCCCSNRHQIPSSAKSRSTNGVVRLAVLHAKGPLRVGGVELLAIFDRPGVEDARDDLDDALVLKGATVLAVRQKPEARHQLRAVAPAALVHPCVPGCGDNALKVPIFAVATMNAEKRLFRQDALDGERFTVARGQLDVDHVAARQRLFSDERRHDELAARERPGGKAERVERAPHPDLDSTDAEDNMVPTSGDEAADLNAWRSPCSKS